MTAQVVRDTTRVPLTVPVTAPAATSLNAPVDTTTAAAGARPITLAEAIALTRQNSPTTIQARGTAIANRAAARAAVGAFLPNLSVSAGAVRQYSGARATQLPNGTIINANSGAWTYSNGLSVQAELFNPQNIPNLRAARADVATAEATVAAQNFAVTVDVAQQYYDALSARESESAAVTQLAQAREQFQASIRKLQAGSATRSDSLRSFVQVAQARVALLTAHTNLRSANAALTRLIGSVEVVTPVPADTVAILPASNVPDSATIVQWALSGPVVSQARAELTAAQARRDAARASYLPSLSAGFSRSGSGQDSKFGLGSGTYGYNGQLNFSLSYPIFNGFSREEQNVRARVNADNANAALRDAELGVRQSAVQYWDTWRTAAEQVAAQQAAVTAAEEDLRVQQTRYTLGVSTIVDVLTSETQLNQARADLITARLNYRIARVRIESLVGRDLTATTLGAPLSAPPNAPPSAFSPASPERVQ